MRIFIHAAMVRQFVRRVSNGCHLNCSLAQQDVNINDYNERLANLNQNAANYYLLDRKNFFPMLYYFY